MKRFLFMLPAVLLLLFALTGCAEKSKLDPRDPVTLTMWHVYGEQADSPMNRLVDEFNTTVGAEKGVLVTVTNVTSTSKISTQLQEAMSNAPDAPEMPDLFSAHTATAAELGADRLLDWKDYFSEDELAGFVPEFVSDGMMGEKLAVFPVSKSTYALFLNGSQFSRFSADTGVSYDDLATWEGFFDAAAQYYQWSGGKPFCAFDYLIRHVEFDVMSKGDELAYTEDGWYDTESSSLRESWLKFARPLAQGHIVVADEYSNTQVMTGETLSGIGSSAGIIYYNDTVTYPDNSSEPMDLKVLPLPKSGSEEQYMPMTGVGLCAYATTEEKAEAASVFVHWLTEGERNLDFVVETGYMPVNNDAFAAIESYTDFPSEGYASLFRAIKTMREDYTPVVRPTLNGYYDKVDTLYAGLRQLSPELRQRAEQGEEIDELAMETWLLFCSIS
ncbi:MAG: extracellular solute-binding protein [Firmicutes bacterium]|nr:extracellular solute-binding protein [Bacillota bacterium]